MQKLILNEDQQRAVDAIIEHVHNPTATYLTVKGGGGVGKSTSVFTAISQIQDELGLSVLLCAPTHKALNVLREMAEEQDVNVDFSTLASALGLRALPEEGQMKFAKDAESKLGQFRVVVIDECSQIGEESLKLLITEAQKYNTILVLMGDNCQLFPVKSYVSPAFSYGDTVTLTKVMRYSGDILRLAVAVRKIIAPEDYDLPAENTKQKINLPAMVREMFPNGSDDITIVSAGKLVDTVIPHTNLEDTDASTIVSWTNDQTDAYNLDIHQRLMGLGQDYDSGTYYVGDKILPQDPVQRGQALVCAIDTVLEIEGIKANTHDLLGRGAVEIPYYEIDVRAPEGRPFTINVVHPEYAELYQQALSEIAGMCKNREVYWSDFWEIKNKFTPVKRPFARTTHKAQGSTYPYTGLDASNIGACHQVALHNRMLYTGLTRASEHLYIGE